MTPLLKSVLLVDDDHATNHYHEIMLMDWGVAENIYKVSNGQEALDFLKDKTYEKPCLIMLDINMPVMNGFEFLEEYEKLEAHEKISYVVFMLTSSLHSSDMDRAKDFNALNGYCEKPMTEEMMKEIMEKIGVEMQSEVLVG
jgi:CheY-like chemotaxis protein